MSDEPSETCLSLQQDELDVLESIYPSCVVHEPSDGRPGRLLTLNIAIALPAPLATQLDATAQPSGSSTSALELSHLPALSLRTLLPTKYPLGEPPKPIALRAPLPSTANSTSSNWLNRAVLRKMQERIGEMWKEEKEVAGEGSGVLWRWWDWVGNGDFLVDLGLKVGDELNLSVPPTIPFSTFHTLLKTFNAAQLYSSFETTAFSCSICLENRKGKSCVRMPGCGCVFCTPCLLSCWELAISEGTLENVSCPSVSCVKKRTTRDPQSGLGDAQSVPTDMDPALVESIVGKELRDRWESLKDIRKAEIDPTYTICPQPKCQAAVPPPPKPSESPHFSSAPSQTRTIRLSDITSPSSTVVVPSTPVFSTPPPTPAATEDRWARYRCCPRCNFSFCLYCSSTWHGPHTACSFPQTSAIVLEYLGYHDGSEGRRRMEAQRGKGNLDRMVAKWKEDEENKRWLDERTRACAGCGVRVEKSHGCNHMTCQRCHTHFCYRCGVSISPQDPYAHYRKPGTSCFEKLFDQEEIERFERETAMRNAGIGPGGEEAEWREVRGFWEW